MTSLKPMYRWLGGKRKEISHFDKYFPDLKGLTYVEPFFGGGAVFFHLNHDKNIINDFDQEPICFLNAVKRKDPIFTQTLISYSQLPSEKLSDLYFRERNKDKNKGLAKLSETDKAIRFFVVNQLSFSGMRRWSKSGEFNINFGFAKTFNTSIVTSQDYIKLLNNTEICNEDFQTVMERNDNADSFMFLDPPYNRVYKKYSSSEEFGEKDHIRLFNTFSNLKNAKCMIVIDRSDFTENLYKNYIKDRYFTKYSLVLKGTFDPNSEHLIITNY